MNTQNSDNYATVADLAEEFHNQKVLDPLVKGDLEKLRQRLSKLFKRVSGNNTPEVSSVWHTYHKDLPILIAFTREMSNQVANKPSSVLW